MEVQTVHVLHTHDESIVGELSCINEIKLEITTPESQPQR